jgi:hypothetical protein
MKPKLISNQLGSSYSHLGNISDGAVVLFLICTSLISQQISVFTDQGERGAKAV